MCRFCGFCGCDKIRKPRGQVTTERPPLRCHFAPLARRPRPVLREQQFCLSAVVAIRRGVFECVTFMLLLFVRSFSPVFFLGPFPLFLPSPCSLSFCWVCVLRLSAGAVFSALLPNKQKCKKSQRQRVVCLWLFCARQMGYTCRVHDNLSSLVPACHRRKLRRATILFRSSLFLQRYHEPNKKG